MNHKININNMSYEETLQMIKTNYDIIPHINNKYKTEELFITAIKHNSESIKYMTLDDLSIKVWREVFKSKKLPLSYIMIYGSMYISGLTLICGYFGIIIISRL
jgi:hypothetical protein